MREMEHALELGRPEEVGESVKRRSRSTTPTIAFRLDPCATGWSASGRLGASRAPHSRPSMSDGVPPETVMNASDERGVGGSIEEGRFG